MKKNQVNAILINNAKRRNIIITYICFILFMLSLSVAFLTIYIKGNKVFYIKYEEKSDIDYKVYLKSNEFFNEPYLDSNKQYIASLIEYIDTNFKYQLNVNEENINYNYQYRIETEVNVKDPSSGRSLYNFKEDILPNVKKSSNNSSTVNINENIQIDYNKYNNLIRKFVNIYDLKGAESTLNVRMYLSVLGECEVIDNVNKESVISLSIPLTTDTVAIDIESNLLDDSEEKLLECNNKETISNVFLIVSILSFIILGTLIYKMVKYIIKTSSAESIYHRELKKILNNYKSYIQKINNSFNLRGYQSLKVDTFTDMLEIRDTIQQPILMVENEEHTGVFFVIPSNTKILYVYSLKVSDIEKDIKKNMKRA